MINLLPPSPAPSQIDTTFIRRERPEVSIERTAEESYFSEESDQVRKPENARDVEDDERDEDRADQPVETTDFATLLSLASQPKPPKKQVEANVVQETQKPDTSKDAESSQSLNPASQWLMMQKSENTPTTDAMASADKPIASAVNTQTSAAARLTQDSINQSPALTQVHGTMKDAGGMPTDALLTDMSGADVQSNPVEESKVTAVPDSDAPRDVASVKVATGNGEPLEVPFEIVSQNSRTSNIGTAESEPQLETTFITSQEPSFATNAAIPERDEVTREIERLISARPGQILPRLTSSDGRMPLTPLNMVTTPGRAGADTATQVVDNVNMNVNRINDVVVASTENDLAPALPRQMRSDQQSSSQQDNDGGPQHHTPSASSNAISATGWSGTSTVANDFVMTTRAEFQEPLSSQTARAIVQHFETRETNDNESLTVRLDPPELGELTIELSQTRDGLAVRVTAREAVTMEMLLSRGHEIEQHLKNQNVDVATMEFLSSGMMNQQSSRQNGSRHSNNDMQIESMRRQSRSTLQSASDTRGDASTVRDSSRPLSFRA